MDLDVAIGLRLQLFESLIFLQLSVRAEPFIPWGAYRALRLPAWNSFLYVQMAWLGHQLRDWNQHGVDQKLQVTDPCRNPNQ